MQKQEIKHKVMPHLMEQHLRLKIQVEMFLKQLLPMDRKQNLKSIQLVQHFMFVK